MKYLVILFVFFNLSAWAQNVPDTLKDNKKVLVILENGVEKSGYLIYDNDEEIKIWSEKIGFIKIQKIQIAEIRFTTEEAKEIKGESENDYSGFNAITNNAFAPSKGDSYIRTAYFSAGVFDYGLTDDLTLGFDAFFFTAMNVNLRYKFDFSESTRLSLSSGFYYTYLGGGFSSNSALFSARAVFTVGSTDKNFSIGGTFVSNFNRIETGFLTFSSITPVSKRTSFITDFIIAPDLRPVDLDLNYFGLGFLGMRIKTRKGNRLDLGIANILTESTWYNWNGTSYTDRVFVPIPYIQLAYKL